MPAGRFFCAWLNSLRLLKPKNAGYTGDNSKEPSKHAGLRQKATGDKAGTKRGQSGDKVGTNSYEESFIYMDYFSSFSCFPLACFSWHAPSSLPMAGSFGCIADGLACTWCRFPVICIGRPCSVWAGEPGRVKAAAADAVGGLAVFPAGLQGGSDFNDRRQAQGLPAVRACTNQRRSSEQRASMRRCWRPKPGGGAAPASSTTGTSRRGVTAWFGRFACVTAWPTCLVLIRACAPWLKNERRRGFPGACCLGC